jgi:hypothetical protein
MGSAAREKSRGPAEFGRGTERGEAQDAVRAPAPQQG